MDLSSAGITQAALSQWVAPIVIALVIALLGAVFAAFLFMGKRNHGRYQGWLQKLNAHLNFDRFILAGILKFLYVFTALFAIVYGLIQLFGGAALTGLLWLIMGPLGFRVVFELLLMLLSLRDEACDTNELLRQMQGLPPKYPPNAQPQPQTAPAPRQSAQRQGAMQSPQVDPRYAQRQGGYPAQNTGFNGYVAVPRQQGQPSATARQPGIAPQMPMRAQPGAADYAASQRYTPARGGYAEGNASGAREPATQQPEAPTPVVRPTPADGTGRFSAVPMRSDKP